MWTDRHRNLGPRGWDVICMSQVCPLTSFLMSSHVGPKEAIAARTSYHSLSPRQLTGRKGSGGYLCFTAHIVSLNEILPCRSPVWKGHQPFKGEEHSPLI